MDTTHIDPLKDLQDVFEVADHRGDGDEPTTYVDEELFYTLDHQEDLRESADVAFRAAIEALNDEADTFEYDALEADEVMGLTAAQLVSQMVRNALLDANNSPMAATYAVSHALTAIKNAIEADFGRTAFPPSVASGIDLLSELL